MTFATLDNIDCVTILDNINCACDEDILPLIKKGGKRNLQLATICLVIIGTELKKIGNSDTISMMLVEIIRLQGACQSFQSDSPGDYLLEIADSIISRLKEYAEKIR